MDWEVEKYLLAAAIRDKIFQHQWHIAICKCEM